MAESTGEREAINNSGDLPVTVESLVDDLSRLGVQTGMTLLVHSSLSSLGWVCGGSVAVVYALEAAIGPSGTLLMPTHSGDLSDPRNWSNPPVPEHWWQTIRDSMPAFDPYLTPTRGMGRIPETFRTQRGVIRSGHPQVSFAACGPNARQIVSDHPLESGLGEPSPLSRVYDLAGWVLLLGVDHSCNTSLHLAESRTASTDKKTIHTAAPLLENEMRRWCEFHELELDSSDFTRIGEEFAVQSQLVKQGRTGNANSFLMPQQELVDFAVSWMEANR